MAASALLLILLASIARVHSQSTDVTECILDYQWAMNHRNQTPCLVAAFLESACSGNPNSVNRTPAGTHYIGPTLQQADSCQCSTVVYSLVEACGGCQGQTQFINYTQWTNNCAPAQIPPVGQFPVAFPSQVEVPSWAELDITRTADTFDPDTAAREAARSNLPPISSLGPSSSTRSPTTLQSQSTPALTPSTPALSASSSDSGGLSPGGIAGITIGVLVLVVGVLLFIFWRMLQARRQRDAMRAAALNASVAPFSEKQGSLSQPPPGHIHSRSLSDPASIVTPFIYNSASPGPRPDSVAASSTYYTTGPMRSSVDDLASPQTVTSPRTIMTVQRSNTPQATGSRGYTGAPEV